MWIKSLTPENPRFDEVTPPPQEVEDPDPIVEETQPADGEATEGTAETGETAVLGGLEETTEGPNEADAEEAEPEEEEGAPELVRIRWIEDTPFMLQIAKKGHPVWMMNQRGSDYSRKHETLDAAKREFWDFNLTD